MTRKNRRRDEGFSLAALTGRWLLLAAVGVSLSLLYVWQHVQLVRTGYAIKGLERERAVWQKNNESLHLGNEKLKNPRRIEQALAGDNMGLMYPQGKNVVRLRSPRHQDAHKEEASESTGGTDTLLTFMRGGGGAGRDRL